VAPLLDICARLRRLVGQHSKALTYLYSRDNPTEAFQAKMLTKDEARRITINVARLRRNEPARAGNHGDGLATGHTGYARHPASASRSRHPHRDGRLRHRLFFSKLFAQLSV